MQFHMGFAQWQTETRSFMAATQTAVDLSERLEHRINILTGDTHTRVRHFEDMSICGRLTCFQQHSAACGRELDTVGHQVDQNLLEQTLVGMERTQCAETCLSTSSF